MAVLALGAAACGAWSETSPPRGSGDRSQAAATFEFKPLDARGPITKEALKRGDVQVALLSSSDPDIAANDWVVLEDDKRLQQPQNLTPAIRVDKASGPVRTALDAVSKKLTTDELIGMNHRNSAERRAPREVAATWLKAQKLLPYKGEGATGSLTIGFTDVAEQQIVAELYTQVLASAGVAVSREPLGPRDEVSPALERGDIDLYPEYLGAYTLFVDADASVPTTAAKAADQLRGLLAPKGITVLRPAAAQDTNAFVVTKATAARYKLSAVSDLASIRDPLVVAGPPECPKRPFCLAGLKSTYGLAFNV